MFVFPEGQVDEGLSFSFCFSCMFVMFCSVLGSCWCLRPHTQQCLLLLSFDFLTEGHFTAKSLRMLFQDISPEKIFNFLKEINIFGKNLNLR